GAAIPIDYSGTIDYSFCGDSFKIQTYSLEEMREILADAPLSISMKSAYVSALRDGRPTGLSAEFAELLAWIAALKISEGERLDGLMRFGGVNGIRAIARMAGEPAIDEKARKKFMLASCILASCISITDGKVLAKNEELAEKISNFSTMEAYSTVSSGTARRREFGGLPCPLPSASPEPHMMRQMALVCISALFQANMNLANRIDSIINSGEREIEENSERLRGMYECLKIGLRTFLNGETISAKTMESFADGKMRELHGGAPHAERKDNMDPGEQSIIRYAVSRLLEETRMDMMLLEQFYRMLPASKSCPREIRQKMDRLLFA
ncbi:MAG: hypothetical protein QXH30_03675, partial [Candidatus Bilamarchaeaceae archaeon]